jgi:Flp pilus assembly protein TadD
MTGCGAFQTSSSQEPRVTLRVAEAAMSSGAPDLALRVADIVLARRPDDVPATLARADALYAMGDMDQSRAAYRRAVMLQPSNAAAQIGLGRTLVRADPQGAEAAFAAAAAQQPDNVTALNDLGIARDMLGRHADAQKAYRMALAVSPDSADVRTNLNLSLALGGEPADRAMPPVAALPRPVPPVTVAAAPPPAADDAAPQVPQAAAPSPVTVAAALPVAVAAPQPLAIQTAPVATVARQNLPPKHVVTAKRAIEPAPDAKPRVDLSAATASLPATDADSALPPLANGLSFAAPLETLVPQSPATAPVPEALAPVKPDRPAEVTAPPQPDPLAAAVEAVLDPAASVAHGDAADPGTAQKPGPRQAAKPVPPHAATRWSVAGYFVQIAALNTEGDARAAWQRLRQRLPVLLSGHAPVFQSAAVKDRMFWRLRTGAFADTGSADAFCRRLRSEGADCWSGPGL